MTAPDPHANEQWEIAARAREAGAFAEFKDAWAALCKAELMPLEGEAVYKFVPGEHFRAVLRDFRTAVEDLLGEPAFFPLQALWERVVLTYEGSNWLPHFQAIIDEELT